MKRWIVVLLVALAVLVLISPGIIGRLAERSIEDGITVAELESPEITISTESFDRGWFSSVGRHRIELSDRQTFPQAAKFADESGYAGMPALIIESRLDHGLVPVSSMTREDGSLVPGIGKLVSTLQLDPGNGELIDLPATVNSTIGLAGDTSGNIVVEPGEWSDRLNRLYWQRSEMQFDIDSRGELTLARGFIEPMTIGTADGEVEIGGIKLDLTQRAGPYDYALGSIDLFSGAVVSTDAYGNRGGYESLSIIADNDIDDDALLGSLKFDMTNISAPAVGNMNIAMHVSYAGFDAEAVALLYDAYSERAQTSDPQTALASLYPEMEAELRQLLAGGGDLVFDKLNISIPQGEIVSDLRLSLPEAGEGDAFSWPGLLLKMQASLNLQMPADVFDMIVAMQPEARSAVAMGFLIPENGEYRMNVEYAQGLATVNGLPMPIPLPGQ